jgi:hypothetical protein
MSERTYVIVMAVLAWFSLMAQFYMNVTSGAAGTAELIVRFFSYFTILTNLMVALYSSVRAIATQSFLSRFFFQPSVATSIAVYIVIVGLIYNVILRATWNPEGFQKLVDELLHSVIPLLYVFYWSCFVSKDRLTWSDIPAWLLYPIGYTLFVLIRGAYADFYPYPFIDARKLSYNHVALNALAISGVFIFVSLIFVACAKWLQKKDKCNV